MTATVPTPRTDLEEFRGAIYDEPFVKSSFARQLERELAALRAMLDAEPSEAMINAGVLAYDTSISASIFGTIKEINKAMRAAQVKEIAAQQVNQSDSLTLTAVAATKQENVK